MYYYCVLKDDNVLTFGKRCNKLKVEDLTSNTVVFLCKKVQIKLFFQELCRYLK